MYNLLAGPLAEGQRWGAWEVWFGDERAVPPDHEHSNYRLARDHLLCHVAVDPARVHRILAERPDLAAAAAAYGALLAGRLPAGPAGPRLDAILLGLGENGHTASLFPGDAALEIVDALATPARADSWPFDRITLTLPAINAAAAVAFVATGAAKSPALRGVVAESVPAARVRPAAGELRWFIDEAASGALAG